MFFKNQKSWKTIYQIENTPVFGPDMPVRLTSHIIKTDDDWKIDYLEWGLITDNEDLAIIAAAIAK